MEELKKALDTLIDNIYVTVGNTVFRQKIGIPMGTDCAPFLANLFLHVYENDFMEKNRRKEWHLCQILSRNHRYIDDMIVFNAKDKFDRIRDDIYPAALTLNAENEDRTQENFLDLDISIKSGRMHVKLYDKRNAFGFPIVNFPFLCGNIPKRIGSSVIISQLVRFGRICDDWEDFQTVTKQLLKKVSSQGFSQNLIHRAVNSFLRHHWNLLAKHKLSRQTVFQKLTEDLPDTRTYSHTHTHKHGHTRTHKHTKSREMTRSGAVAEGSADSKKNSAYPTGQ